MSKKQHKNYVKFLDWKKQRNKDREIKKLDIKFNQWKDYEGKYKGRLLTPMEYQQFALDAAMDPGESQYPRVYVRGTSPL